MSEREDTARLISALLDEQIEEDERVRLELLIETDAAARRLYFQMIDHEIELSCLFVPADAGKVVSLASGARRSQRMRRWFAAAALIAALAALWLLFLPRGTKRPADFVSKTWSADFENGTAPRWVGELVSADLPRGSRYAIRTMRETNANGVLYRIELPADWNTGLFALTARSTLHMNYRIGQQTGLDVLLHTMSDDRGIEKNSMFRLTGARFPGSAGVWQTASIPFALFQRKVSDPATGEMTFSGGSPRAGEVVAAMSFSLPFELDLVIDRIWITPTGPAQETITPL
jgi:hypothetical protein